MNITQQLSHVTQVLGCQFTVAGNIMPLEQVFSPTGLLPAIMRRADQLCSFCLGYGLGLTFERSETALKGVVVLFDEAVPTSLRLLCILDVLVEFMQQSPTPQTVSLDELMQD